MAAMVGNALKIEPEGSVRAGGPAAGAGWPGGVGISWPRRFRIILTGLCSVPGLGGSARWFGVSPGWVWEEGASVLRDGGHPESGYGVGDATWGSLPPRGTTLGLLRG